MAGSLQPLDQKFAIVGPDGRPTDYFTRWAQQRQIDIGEGITLLDLEAFLTAHKLVPGVGIQFAPDGDINNRPVIHADVQAILDEITATRGTILYRGLLGWAALAPGTAGKILQSNGAGTDPTWAAPAGGGGSSIFPINAPPFGSFTWMNQLTSTFTTNSDGSVTLTVPAVGSQSMHGVFIPLGGATYDHRIGFIPAMQSTGFQICGVALLDSVSGKFILFGNYRDAGTACLHVAMNFPSPTGAQTNVNIPATPSNWTHALPTYVHLKDDGVNRTCNIGLEPNLFPFLGYSQPTNTYITPDKIGLVYGNQSGSNGFGLTCFDWR